MLLKRSLRLWLCVVVALGAGGLVADPASLTKADPHRQMAAEGTRLSAEEILRRALEARGGEAAAARIRSFRCKGTADFAPGIRVNFESVAARPNCGRETYELGERRWEYASDGETAWEAEPGTAPKALSGGKLQESRDEAAWFAWYDDPRAYRLAAYTGEIRFEGARCYELKIKTQSGLEQTHYYNATNYLLAGMLERVTLDTGPTWRLTIFLEYGTFAGFRLPTRYRCRMEETEWVIRVTSVQVNSVNGSVFGMSGAKPDSETAERPAGLSDDEIKTILADCIDADKLGVGLVAGLIDARGSRVIACGKMDNGSSLEVDGETLFEIGSITKVFTRLLLHDMVARGEMNLEDPVQKYLPPSVRMPTHHGKQITLWDLTTHTSGLPRDMDQPATVEGLYTFLARHRLRRDPGEEFEYSNVGVALLGHIIALKTGQDYEALVRERICRPLKMDSTAITLPPELQARRATGHAPASRPAGYIGLRGLPGAGGFFSTANDLLKLASATLGLTPCPLTPLMKKTNGGHNGGTFGFSTMLALDPKQRRALVVLSNCRDDDLVDRLRPLLKNQSPKPPGAVTLGSAGLDLYVGQYYAGEGRIRTVRRERDRLLLQEWGKPGCEIFPLSETSFYNELFDCRATFLRDGSTGRARELTIGGWRGARTAFQVLPPSGTALTEADCPPRKDSDIQGVWKARLRVWYWPFVSVRLKVRIAEPSPGVFRGEGDSPDQDANGLPLHVVYNRPVVDVLTLDGAGSFHGKLNRAHNKVSGLWKQDGHTIHVTFRRADAEAKTPVGVRAGR